MSNRPLAPVVDLLKTLAHPARLRILALLRDGELCVCQITEVLGIPASTASEHLTELRRAGLLAERKDGRWVYYGLLREGEHGSLLESLWAHLDGVDLIDQDHQAALATRSVPVEVTCAKGRACGPVVRSARLVRHGR